MWIISYIEDTIEINDASTKELVKIERSSRHFSHRESHCSIQYKLGRMLVPERVHVRQVPQRCERGEGHPRLRYPGAMIVGRRVENEYSMRVGWCEVLVLPSSGWACGNKLDWPGSSAEQGESLAIGPSGVGSGTISLRHRLQPNQRKNRVETIFEGLQMKLLQTVVVAGWYRSNWSWDRIRGRYENYWVVKIV